MRGAIVIPKDRRVDPREIKVYRIRPVAAFEGVAGGEDEVVPSREIVRIESLIRNGIQQIEYPISISQRRSIEATGCAARQESGGGELFGPGEGVGDVLLIDNVPRGVDGQAWESEEGGEGAE